MLTHRGYSAWIVVNGQPLPEYLVAVNSETHQVSCWIPSEEGQQFSVHWQDHGSNVDTASYIVLDGFTAPGRFLCGTGETYRSGVRTGENTERPFVFRQVAENTTSFPSSKDIGMIVLKIKRVTRTGKQQVDGLQQLSRGPQGNRRPGDIYVGFGEESQSYKRWDYTWSVEPHADGSGNPASYPTYVSFVFRYRSYEFLQAQGIAQAPVTPSTTSTGTSIARLPTRRIMSAPAVPNNPQHAPSSSNPSSRMQRHANKLSAGVPSTIQRNSSDTRRTTLSVPYNTGHPGTRIMMVTPPRPAQYYRQTNNDSDDQPDNASSNQSRNDSQ